MHCSYQTTLERPVGIKGILDLGAHGIILPRIHTKEEVEAAVEAKNYPLEGIEGWCNKSLNGEM